MTQSDGFPQAITATLSARKEITIVTGPSDRPRETVIWVAVDDRGRVWVRSVRGPRGRWYRDLSADPQAAIDLGDGEIGVKALPAGGADDVQACSDALRAKYAGNASLASMLAPETLPTTVQLVPR
jgi:hypothetical protein